jgi:hypothetical protein
MLQCKPAKLPRAGPAEPCTPHTPPGAAGRAHFAAALAAAPHTPPPAELLAAIRLLPPGDLDALCATLRLETPAPAHLAGADLAVAACELLPAARDVVVRFLYAPERSVTPPRTRPAVPREPPPLLPRRRSVPVPLPPEPAYMSCSRALRF